MATVRDIKLPVLGRSFEIGALYNYREEQILHGPTAVQAVQQLVIESQDLDGQVQITLIEDEATQKLSLFGLNGTQQLSVIGGLMDAREPAVLIRDTINRTSTKTAFLHCMALFRTEEIAKGTIGELIANHVDPLNRTPTHVVSRITFGTEVIFTVKLAAEDKETADEEYRLMMEQLKLIVAGQRVAGRWPAVEVIASGDIDIAIQPSAFQFQAIFELLKQMPKIMQDGRDKASAKFVELHPLFPGKDDAVLCQLPDELVQKVLDDFETLRRKRERLLDLTESCRGLKFKWVEKDIQIVAQKLSSLVEDLKRKVCRMILDIRSGTVSPDEEVLVAFPPLDWFDQKESEIDVLYALQGNLKNHQFLSGPGALKQMLRDDSTKKICCLEMNMTAMADGIVQSINNQQAGDSLPVPWHLTEGTLAAVRQLVHLVDEFAEAGSCPEWKYVCYPVKASAEIVTCFLLENGEKRLFVPPGAPVKPTIIETTSSSVTISWLPLNSNVSHYFCSWRTRGEEWTEVRTVTSDATQVVRGLMPDWEYQFRVAAACDDVVSAYIPIQGFVRTLPNEIAAASATPTGHSGNADPSHSPLHLAQDQAETAERPMHQNEPEASSQMVDFILQSSVPQNENVPQIFFVHGQLIFEDPEARIYRYHYGPLPPPQTFLDEQVVLIMGETGAGKSTLINAMFNALFGVQFDNNVRFRVVNETGKSTGHSRTKDVVIYTCYNPFEGGRPIFTTIIDTPGFNDTTGMDQDETTREQLHRLFSTEGPGGIDHINAVGIVAKSSDTRDTSTQKYISNCVSSIFSKEIEENIFLLCTFADNKEPEILQTGRDFLTEGNWFPFNNCALYQERQTSNGTANVFAQFYWDMGSESIKRFLQRVRRVTPKSICLSVEVMEERRRLQAIIDGLRPEIRSGLAKMAEIRLTRQIMEQRQTEINANKDFSFTVDVPGCEKVAVPTGKNATHCLTCVRTCHDDCAYSDNRDKDKCVAMKDGKCMICPGKCIWDKHVAYGYVIVDKIVKTTQTSKEMMDKYGIAKGAYNQAEELLFRMQLFLRATGDQVTTMIRNMRVSICRLEEIALRPNAMTSADFIEKLIRTEEDEHKTGYELRITSLKAVKERAVLLDAIKNGDMTGITGSDEESFFDIPPPPSFGNYNPLQCVSYFHQDSEIAPIQGPRAWHARKTNSSYLKKISNWVFK